MTILLDGIDLGDLVIDGEFGFSGVEAAVEKSLGGVPVIWEGETSGRPIDLTGTEENGWLTRNTLLALLSRASVIGATYVLAYEADSYTVRFRNEDSPAISATPVMPTPEVESGDFYNNVKIKLMEV